MFSWYFSMSPCSIFNALWWLLVVHSWCYLVPPCYMLLMLFIICLLCTLDDFNVFLLYVFRFVTSLLIKYIFDLLVLFIASLLIKYFSNLLVLFVTSLLCIFLLFALFLNYYFPLFFFPCASVEKNCFPIFPSTTSFK
jgi:hypothetical protein